MIFDLLRASKYGTLRTRFPARKSLQVRAYLQVLATTSHPVRPLPGSKPGSNQRSACPAVSVLRESELPGTLLSPLRDVTIAADAWTIRNDRSLPSMRSKVVRCWYRE